MKKLKLFLTIVVLVLTLASCSLNHTSHPSNPGDDQIAEGESSYTVTIKYYHSNETIISLTKKLDNFVVLSDINYSVVEGYDVVIVNEQGEIVDIEEIRETCTLYVKYAPKTYKLQYIENGTKTYEFDVPYAESIQALEPKHVPTGYKFVGWSSSATEYVPYEFTTMPASGVAVYAHYEEVKYSITLITNVQALEGITNSVSYAFNERLDNYVPLELSEAISNLEKYTLVGWYLDPEFTIPFEEITMPNHDVTLYAKWEYDGLTFVDGDVMISIGGGSIGDVIQLPANPTKKGYEFVGWYYDAEFTMPVQDGDVITEDIQKIYAKFNALQNVQYKVEYYLQTFGVSYVLNKSEQFIGTTGEMVSADILDFTGFTYDASNSDNLLSSEILADGSLVLKVYYSRNVYTIEYYTFDGLYQRVENIKFGANVIIPENPSRTGYTFDGWDNTIPSTMPAENLTFTAKWVANGNTLYKVQHYQEQLNGEYALFETRNHYGTSDSVVDAPINNYTGFTYNPSFGASFVTGVVEADGSLVLRVYYSRNTYTIRYISNGSGYETYENVYYGANTPKPVDPAKVGWTFIEWDQVIPETVPAHDITLNAVWKINQYKLTIIYGNGNADSEFVLDFEEQVPQIFDPTRVGYTFKEWSEGIPATMPAEDLEISAVWTINQYTLTIDVDGVKTTVEYDYNEAVEVPAAPSKTGYTFAGWANLPSVMPATDVTTTATWTINQYTYIFQDEDGTELKKVTADYGTTIVAPADPTKAATQQYTYTFAGWDQEFDILTGDVVIKATYGSTVNQYTYIFQNEDGTELKKVTADYGTTIVAPADPTKAATAEYTYTFAGWNQEFDTLTEDIVIKATYTQTSNIYTLTVVVDGVEQAFNYAYGSQVTPIADPQKDGYTFVEWSIAIPTIMPAENVTVNAIWEPIIYVITYDFDGGTPNIDNIILDFLNDYNTARGKSHTIDSFYAIGQWDEISDASLFLYNSNYKDKWSWLVKYISEVAGAANKPAYQNFFKYNSQAELNAANSNYIYEIAYELRAWVGQKQYTKNSDYKTADYSTESVQSAIWNYISLSEYTIESSEFVLPELSKFGYVFDGWFMNGVKVTSIPQGSMGDKELIAKFTIEEHSFELNLNGGQLPNSYYVSVPSHPIKQLDITAYTNDGNTKGTYICNKGIMPGFSLRWQYKILLQYDSENPGWYKVVAVDAAKATVNDAASNAGVTWTHALSNSSSNITTLVSVGQYLYIPSNIELGDTNIIGTICSTNDTNLELIDMIYGPLMPHTLGVPTKTGYDFVGWFTNPEFNGSPISVLGTQGKNLTLYAKFALVEYDIDVELNGGELDDSYFNYGFAGSTQKDISLSKYDNSGLAEGIYFCDTTVISQNSLKWQYKILLQYDAEKDAYLVVACDKATAEANSLGVTWTHALASAGTNVSTYATVGQYIKLSKNVVIGDTNFTAYVYDENQYGKLGLKEDSYSPLVPVTLPTPTKVGHTFEGWYDNPEFAGVKYVTLQNEGKDLVLYAKWTALQYTYTFQDENGTVLKEETVDYGSQIVAPANPTKAGDQQFSYEFAGWDQPFDTVVGDVVIKATYNQIVNKYTYTFQDEDGTVLKQETVDYGTEIVAPANPSKEATQQYTYTFNGWDQPFNKVVEDVVIKATYSATVNKYTYTFQDENGTILKQETVDYGTEIVAPSEPTKDATPEFTYTFNGWDQAFDKVVEDVVIKATYTAIVNKYTVSWEIDGVIVRTDSDVPYGTEVSYGEIPTKDLGDDYVYVFKTWTPESLIVTGDVVYVAQFDKYSQETIITQISKYADDNNWVNGTQYTSLIMNEYIYITTNNEGNTAKYYTTGEEWRFYQTSNSELTINSTEYAKILTVKITYNISNTGTLLLNGNKVASNSGVQVNNSSVKFTIGNTGSATNGQAKITKIEVVYLYLACEHEYVIENETCSTCSTQGTIVSKCTKCNKESIEYKDTLPHNEVHHDGLEPTCTEKGYGEYITCENCSYSTKVEIAAKGHTYVDGKCNVCGQEDPNYGASEVTATLSFDNTAQRTEFSTTKQVWKQNDIILTNEKGSSTSDVGNYAKPVRLYAKSKVTVEAKGQIIKIVFDCNSSSYATTLKNSIGTVSGATVSVSSDKVTVTFTTPVSSFVIANLTAQVRLDAITVTYKA